MGIITGIRNIRAEADVHPSTKIEAFILCPSPAQIAFIRSFTATLADMTRLSSLVVAGEGEKPTDAATYLYKDMEIYVPLKGLVDVEKETAKLVRERQKVEVKLVQINAKLVSEKFLSNAPADVVMKEREKKEELDATLAKISEAEQRLQDLG